MGSELEGGSPSSEENSTAAISVPEIRDYHRINAELTQLLDQGVRRVKLVGVEKQRLLLAEITGPWSALVEVEGNAGPELGSRLNAPNLRILCRGSVADGLGSGLVDGKVLVLGDAGAGAGVSQRGGSIIVAGSAAERAGLNQYGGQLALLGEVGRLAGERQSGGTFLAFERNLAEWPGRNRRGGLSILLGQHTSEEQTKTLGEILRPFQGSIDVDRLADSSIRSIFTRLGVG